jgi:hypothetical protein
MKRFGSAAWNGGLREGKRSVSTESRALETYPHTFFSRYGEKPGANPEELLWAAHAACFTISFVGLRGMANFVPEQIDSKSGSRPATAFPSPRSISPSPRRYRASTRPRSRLPALQVNERRDRIRGHSCLVKRGGSDVNIRGETRPWRCGALLDLNGA